MTIKKEIIKIFAKDKDLAYLWCNENYAKDFKLDSKDIIGKTDFDLYSKKLAEKYRRDDKLVIKSGKTKDIEEFYKIGGNKFYVQTIKTPIKDKKNKIIGVLGIFWDTSFRKNEKDELKKSQEQYKQLVENINDVIFSINAQGILTYISPAIKKISGWNSKELIGSKFIKFVHQDDIKELVEKFNKVLSGGLGFNKFRFLTKKGNYIWVRVSSRPDKKKDKVIGVTGLFFDITENKKIEEELREKLRELERMNELMIGRELKMVKLKEEINKLKNK